jgi:hypothetical protein
MRTKPATVPLNMEPVRPSPANPITQSSKRAADSVDLPCIQDLITNKITANRPPTKEPSSLASRKRRRAGLSMGEIYAGDVEDEGENPRNHSEEFAPDSTVHNTWGVPATGPFHAARKRRHIGLQGLVVCRGKQSAFAKYKMEEMIETEPCAPNNPERCILLRFPLEIRWEIYGYLLIHDKNILVHSDLSTVHPINPPNHSVLRICKQMALEATCFMYEKNVFHVLVRQAPREMFCANMIYQKYLPFLRKVIIEPAKENWSSKWLKATAGCIEKLTTAGTVLESLTIIISPQKLGPKISLVGMEQGPISFSDWFFATPKVPLKDHMKHVPVSCLMLELVKLRCKVINIIIRLGEGKKALISLNVGRLKINQVTDNWLPPKPEVMWRKRCNEILLKRELRDLKARIEAVFMHPEKMIDEGKARWMDKNSNLG